MLELSLKEYCKTTGIEFTDEEIAILETYIELKIKDVECKMWKSCLSNIKGELYPFKVTYGSVEGSSIFENKK